MTAWLTPAAELDSPNSYTLIDSCDPFQMTVTYYVIYGWGTCAQTWPNSGGTIIAVVT